MEAECVELVDRNTPYTSGPEDFFNEGMIMSRTEIDSQNTPWMKAQAEKYSIVLRVLIAQKKP
jgi:hypothetical protein